MEEVTQKCRVNVSEEVGFFSDVLRNRFLISFRLTQDAKMIITVFHGHGLQISLFKSVTEVVVLVVIALYWK